MKLKFIPALLILNLSSGSIAAQDANPISNDSLKNYLIKITKELDQLKKSKPKSMPYFSTKSGLGFASPDSSYSLNIRFRIQNRILMNTASDEDLNPETWEARVRRCRLSLTGHVVNPKITYYLQLSFSRGDMDWSDVDASKVNTSPNVVRDAMIYYKPSKSLQLGIGQTKLPGNRQRIISSGAQQFYDRSIVNSNFTTDRDFGIFLNHTTHLGGNAVVLAKAAISSGEGRNSISGNSGLAYTGRLEFLPLGAFTDNGDYYEGDLAREEKPKISIAGAYHFNDMSVRTGGQLGKDLLGTKSFNVYIADFVFKYKGFALSSEYIRRDTEGSPYVKGSDNKVRPILTGDGINTQMSYCTKNMWELAIRHSLVSPHCDVLTSFNETEQYGLGLSKYLNKHKVKLQGNIFYNRDRNLVQGIDLNKSFFAVFQVELGI
jgi:phosphate-selective porin OprO and OprP